MEASLAKQIGSTAYASHQKMVTMSCPRLISSRGKDKGGVQEDRLFYVHVHGMEKWTYITIIYLGTSCWIKHASQRAQLLHMLTFLRGIAFDHA